MYSPRRALLRLGVVSPALLSWSAIGLSINMAADGDWCTVAMSTVGLAHSAVAFFVHGGRRISAPGTYMLGTGLFVFFPGIYLVLQSRSGGLPFLSAAVSFIYFSQILAYYLVWKPHYRPNPPPTNHTDRRVTRWGIWVGVVLTGLGAGGHLAGYDYQLLDAAAFTGIVIYAVAAFRRPFPSASPFSYLMLVGGFVCYTLIVFTGFGRLVLGTLGISLASAVAHRWKGRLVKAAFVGALAPGLIYLARSRVQFTASLNPNQDASVTGLESVVAPMIRFSQLIEMDIHGHVPHLWGSSLLASAVALVPRAIWAGKPKGFGAELAAFFRPDLARTGHSEAALFHGEWLFNFGLFSLPFLIPLLAFAINRLDQQIVIADASPLTNRRQLLVVVALLIAASGLVDLLWGGLFTFVARAGPRLLIVFVLFVLFGRMPSTSKFDAVSPGVSRDERVDLDTQHRSPKPASIR